MGQGHEGQCQIKAPRIMDFGELQVWDEYLDFEDLSKQTVRRIIESHRALLVELKKCEEEYHKLGDTLEQTRRV